MESRYILYKMPLRSKNKDGFLDMKKSINKNMLRNTIDFTKYPECYLDSSGEVPLIKFSCLRELDWMELAFSTRLGGVSQGHLASLNLGFDRGDDIENVKENYRRVCRSIGGDYRRLVLSDQVHDTKVIYADEGMAAGEDIKKKLTGIDGLMTDISGLILATSYADCVPLFLVDIENKAIASSHSGWRGTVGKIGEKTISAMEERFGSKPENIICIIGPSICQDCYEVSDDVIREFQAAYSETQWDDIFRKKQNVPDKYELNLWQANYHQFADAGIRPENIHISGICTCCHHDTLFSHRASNGRRGNLNGFMMIRQ